MYVHDSMCMILCSYIATPQTNITIANLLPTESLLILVLIQINLNL